MKIFALFLALALLNNSCDPEPVAWNGPKLTEPRDQLTIEHLFGHEELPLIDMSFFARPEWAQTTATRFSGAISFKDTEMIYPLDRVYYPGENTFPGITLDFISHSGELIPVKKEILVNSLHTKDAWNVIVGTGRVWHEAEDGDWSRASFPLSLTDSYIGQVRNCVATFLYNQESISNVCLQCSQETADYNDHQVGNIRALLPVEYHPGTYSDSASVIEQREHLLSNRLPVYDLSTIDRDHEIASYFQKKLYTRAPTSLGAVVMDEAIYLQAPTTRHGLYPYPNEMRHGVYSVSKSMAGALAMFYFAERYDADIFDALISDYVPPLSGLPEWQGVTFSHTLNMVTGTEGGEDAGRLYEVIVKARSANEAIHNIAKLGNTSAQPGQNFNYASTNFFVLSYALQNYVKQKEGDDIIYWDLVHENVLVPLGADDFYLLRTVESEGPGIPLLAYGAYPTLDHAAKIALLISNEGQYKGQQILNKEKCREALGRTSWSGYSTGNDFRGSQYRHSFWATPVAVNGCDVDVSYMLGYGGNYVWFLPSKVIAIRFMDEYDLEFKGLIRSLEKIKSSCP